VDTREDAEVVSSGAVRITHHAKVAVRALIDRLDGDEMSSHGRLDMSVSVMRWEWMRTRIPLVGVPLGFQKP